MADKPAFIVIRENDNVATATRDIAQGEEVAILVGGQETTLTTKQGIRFLHKVALKDMSVGERVCKYGATIGEATQPIAAGEHVHVHNIRSLWGRS